MTTIRPPTIPGLTVSGTQHLVAPDVAKILDPSERPLHSKLTGCADVEHLRCLAETMPAKVRERLLKALSFLDDPTIYEKMLQDCPLTPEDYPPDKSRYSVSDVQKQMSHNLVCPQSDPLAMCIPFTVLEEKMKEILEADCTSSQQRSQRQRSRRGRRRWRRR